MTFSRKGSVLIAVLLMVLPHGYAAAQAGDDDFTGGRSYSSRFQSQIDALGATVVLEIPIPVLGVAIDDLTKNFGDARGDGSRVHQGLDILADEGMPIVSPTDAVVTRTGSGANSGLFVRTANPGGEQFVYMHLSAIAAGVEAGDVIKRGDIIGFVGNTGNASAGPAHLHFEIRKDGAQDPFPRLTSVFTSVEREESLRNAQAGGMNISESIVSRFTGSGASIGKTEVASSTSLESGAVIFGDTSAKIASLQKFLIASPKGPTGRRLAHTGATGYFGPLTREALIEYQRFVGLDAKGVVDSLTHAHIFSLPADSGISETEELSKETNAALPKFLRDLEFGMTGPDVRELQKFLNKNEFFIASSGDGSPGNETDYFGSRTRAALARYQSVHAIVPAAGYLGPKTRLLMVTR
jgi:peptidoglycan hydrolase-like protein with peptidoglycan-binding domain